MNWKAFFEKYHGYEIQTDEFKTVLDIEDIYQAFKARIQDETALIPSIEQELLETLKEIQKGYDEKTVKLTQAQLKLLDAAIEKAEEK